MSRNSLPVLLLGLLSMLFAEIYSGASQLWFIDPFGIISTLPLYMFHLVLFLNIAIRAKKFAIKKLYILGMIFALYESWITTVLWNGYITSDPNARPIFGKFLGIAINEYVTLVFFWHPVMSFCIPILTYEILARESGGKIIGSHERYLIKNRGTRALTILVPLLLATNMANGAKYNLFVAILSPAGTLALVLLVYWLATRNGKSIGIQNLILGKKGLILVSVYLAGLYIVWGTIMATYGFYPSSPLPYAIILLSYAIFFVLWKIAPKDREQPEKEEYSTEHINYLSKNDFLLANALFIIMAAFYSLFPEISIVVGTITYLSYFPLGIYILITTIISLRK